MQITIPFYIRFTNQQILYEERGEGYKIVTRDEGLLHVKAISLQINNSVLNTVNTCRKQSFSKGNTGSK